MKATCPNCTQKVDPANPRHGDECVVGALLGILADRGTRFYPDTDLSRIDVDALMSYVDRAVENVAFSIDVTCYPGGD